MIKTKQTTKLIRTSSVLTGNKLRGYPVHNEWITPKTSDYPRHKCHSLCRPDQARHFIVSPYQYG